MSDLISTDTQRLILGLGKTGHSMATWLSAQGKSYRVMDTRAEPPFRDAAIALCGQDRVHLGGWQESWLAEADELYVSPGLALAEPLIQQALARGAKLLSDVDLYCQVSEAQVVAVTGSNGKSTVVTLLEHIAQELGVAAIAGGNLGTPVLELLECAHEVAILELSSFQLEMVSDLAADVAMVLNVSPDHMDRYADIMAYRAAKHRIFSGCRGVVFNADDPMTQPLVSEQMPRSVYSLQRQDIGLWGIRTDAQGVHLMDGLDNVFTWPSLRLKGRHNLLNILAALGATRLLGWPLEPTCAAIATYAGLPHRCEWVAEHAGVTFINDSKGTNVGATLAALDGLSPECAGRLHLLAGGDGKAADFEPLVEACARLQVPLYTFGRDGTVIADIARANRVETTAVHTLTEALQAAHAAAVPGDWVLLSPACASFDQYSGFAARGEDFIAAVEALKNRAAKEEF